MRTRESETRPPRARGNRASDFDALGSEYRAEDNAAPLILQSFRIRNRLSVSWPMARAMAELAYATAGRRA